MAINLLPQEFRQRQNKLRVLRTLLTKTSTVLLILYLVVLLAIVGTLTFFSRRLASVDLENQTRVSQINSLRVKEGLLLSLRNRTDFAKKIFSQTSSPEETVDKLVSLLPGGVQMIEVSAQESELSLTLQADSSQSLVSFFDNLRSSNLRRVNISSLNQSGQGGYIFSLEVN